MDQLKIQTATPEAYRFLVYYLKITMPNLIRIS